MIVTALLLAAVVAPQNRAAFPGSDEDGSRTVSAQPRCDPAAEEITVCGNRDQSQFRMGAPDSRFDPKPFRPDFKLPGGGTGKVQAVQRSVGPGASAPGAMVTLRIPLGKRKKTPAAQ